MHFILTSLQALLYFLVFQRTHVSCQIHEDISPTEDDDVLFDPTEGMGPGGPGGQAAAVADRYTLPTTTTTKLRRTTPEYISFVKSCDTYAFHCTRTFQTGPICARTMYYRYKTFTSYCFVEFVNCMYRYQMWQIVNVGRCQDLEPVSGLFHYNYDDDSWLDEDYILDEA